VRRCGSSGDGSKEEMSKFHQSANLHLYQPHHVIGLSADLCRIDKGPYSSHMIVTSSGKTLFPKVSLKCHFRQLRCPSQTGNSGDTQDKVTRVAQS